MSFKHQQLSPVLTRRAGWHFPQGAFTHAHWCPACETFHDFAVEQPFRNNNACWTFDGNAASPTFSPSMNISVGPFPDGHMEICHYYLQAGKIIYLNDCTHHFKGQTVDLPPLPEGRMISWDKV